MTNEAQIQDEVTAFYRKQREAGKSPRRAHTLTTTKAARLLGTQSGAWDCATKAQELVDGVV